LEFTFPDAPVRDDAARIELISILSFCFADFHAAADPIGGHRVAAGVERNVAIHVDDTFGEPVDLGN
jgi:hypothetical protein